MSLNIFIWAVALCSHAACKSFAGLFAFYVLYAERVHGSCWLLVSNGWNWSNYHRFHQLWLFAHTYHRAHDNHRNTYPHHGAIVLSLFPDSPTNAWFLTEDERTKAVRRIKENQTGIENKRFKRDQMIEALTDPKTWLFALYAAINNVPSSVINQLQIIIVSFGFNPLQTTLLGCVYGVGGIVSVLTAVTIASRIPNSIAWVGIAYYIPSFLGMLLVNFLPWHDKVGLLFSVWITITTASSFVLSLTWISQTTAGHTKKVITNATVLSAYCIGNATGHSCGGLNISLATMFRGLWLVYAMWRAWPCCFPSEYYWHVRTNGAMQSHGMIRLMMYT
ncbi:major facilitator superfamily domain-containing protein [Russula vinacea]|nr:major facilitator superfamily domain-containing protein [Russula vinacea]